MATSLGEHSSTSYPAEGEMVGIGARRKNICRNGSQNNTSRNSRRKIHKHDFAQNHQQNDFVVSQINDINSVPNKFERRSRRIKKHVYDEIDSVRSEVSDLRNMQVGRNNTGSPLPETKNSICKSRTSANKPEIPPKPTKYVLRDKRLRHVYQTIELSTSNGTKSEPPPLPEKPFHLRRFSDDPDIPPPLPPRVPNREAIKQRHKLDVEYFENLRKNVDDGTLLDLAEEGDLPVPINPDEMNNAENSGQASAAVDLVNPAEQGRQAEEQHSALDPTRRHSLPTDDFLSGAHPEPSRISAPYLPPRASSVESTPETRAAMPVCCDTDDTRKTSESTQAKIFENLLLLKKCGWYWGNMTWQEAEALLAEKEGEGVFLMRDSQNPLHLLTLTVRSAVNTIHHIRVEYSDGKFQLYEPGHTVSRSAAQCARHSNVEQFIKLAMKHSKSGSFLYFVKPRNMGEPPIQIRLLAPVSRLSKVKSLQYNCRMVIRNHVVADLISELSVPHRIKEYLLAGPYYDIHEEHRQDVGQNC